MRRLIRWIVLIVLVCALLLVGIELIVMGMTRSMIYEQASALSHEEVALVLGASIRGNGDLSPVLRERADAALSLYRAGVVKKILVSGDNGTRQYDEVYPVGKYLLAQGVPKADIFLDYAGFDTYSSIYRAKNVFGVSSMIITSQRFHLPRALLIARALNIPAVGFDVSESGENYFENSLREIPATDKALLDLFLHRTPTYVGEKFPITGSSAPTWLATTTQMIYFQNGK